MMTETTPSPVEVAKANSAGLAGRIADQLDDGTDGFGPDERHLIKCHGIYQQKNRDDRNAPPSFMLRVRLPGGRLTSEQYLCCDEIATRFGNATFRLTTRQTIQFHGVAKRHLKPAIAALHAVGLTTAAACGDVVRNITLPFRAGNDARTAELNRLAIRLSDHLLFRSTAYEEIWLDAKPGARDEPLYGPTYLPRKFKIALTVDGENGADLLTNDLGLAASFTGTDVMEGFFVHAGGGLGMLASRPRTFPRLADLVGWIAGDRIVEVIEAAVAIHRDYGDRADRHHARLKYLLAEKGVAWFRGEIERRAGLRFQDRTPAPWSIAPILGRPPDRDGMGAVGLRIPFGRVADADGRPLRSALRQLIRDLRLSVTVTSDQGLVLHASSVETVAEIEKRFDGVGVLPGDYPPLMERMLVCPALPTCPLALAESERVAGRLVIEIQNSLDRLGLAARAPVLRMTGCFNGCARPSTAEIGIIGERAVGGGEYALFVGGAANGTRLAFRIASRVPLERIPLYLEGLFRLWKEEGAVDEGLGDFTARVGADRLVAVMAAMMEDSTR